MAFGWRPALRESEVARQTPIGSSHGRALSASAPRLPDTGRRRFGLGQDVRSRRFRHVPFRRDVAFDPGGATAPRITVPHILPSTLMTGSASATLSISRLNLAPQQIAMYALQSSSPITMQHSLPGGRYGLTRAGLLSAGTRQIRPTHHKRPYAGAFRFYELPFTLDNLFLANSWRCDPNHSNAGDGSRSARF